MSNLYARIVRFLNNRKKNPEIQWEQGCTAQQSLFIPVTQPKAAGRTQNKNSKNNNNKNKTRSSVSKVVAVNAVQSN